MDRFTYLFLGLAILLPVIVCFILRYDLRNKILKFGGIGGVTGIISEAFYFRDYWRPINMFGVATLSLEDFLFGFAITSLSFAAYATIFQKTFKNPSPRRGRLYLSFFVLGLVAMVIFNVGIGFNSIFVSSCIFIILSSIILYTRRDLLKPAFYSVVFVISYVLVIYVILFSWIDPMFWDKYWRLAGTMWDIRLVGAPLTELLWYASWIIFASISYAFVSGRKFSNKRDPQL